MEEGKSHPSYVPSVAYPYIQLLLDWSTVFLVLISMTVQVILVCGGTLGYRTGNQLINFIIWVCYMGADYVATSALGAMIHYSTRERVYAIWASVLMVHLGGGPDTITAYSVPDSNLWRRHCFSMLYQGMVAVYVVYVSAVDVGGEIEWHLLAAASLIFTVGIIKYVERTRALWLASPPQIVRSVKPIYNFMKIEHALGFHIDEQIPDDEIADVDTFVSRHEDKVDLDKVDYQYIVEGEECFDEDDDDGGWTENIVTIKDVWEHEREVVTGSYLLCVSHALFKMYKRRFVSLRFQEEEHVILVWHVATTICKKLDEYDYPEDSQVKRDVRWSVMMSRYFAYLLVSSPNILPVEVESAKMVFTELFSHIAGIAKNASLDDFCKNFKDRDWGVGSLILTQAKEVVIKMLICDANKRWRLFAERWLDILRKCGAWRAYDGGRGICGC